MNLIKNTEMTTAQKETAFEVLGGYISSKQVKEIIVDLHDKVNGQIIVKAFLTSNLIKEVIIGARGRVIAHA